MTELPPLPEPDPSGCVGNPEDGWDVAWNKEQMREYGAACAAAERERLTQEPLSDEQIDKLHNESFEPMPRRKNCYMSNHRAFARAIEAAIRARATAAQESGSSSSSDRGL